MILSRLQANAKIRRFFLHCPKARSEVLRAAVS
jgi:hypothetical protein